MNIKEILKTGIINTAMVARNIYPIPEEKATSEEAIKKYNKASAIRLHKKINEQDKQRLTDNDLELIEKYLKNILK